jgi:TetR/AcrR family transcriptional regulator, cholesterol catabolism regulator
VSRRDEILDTARTQFARKGYSNTSMRDIADASGLLAGSLYSHFRSKMDMVGEIVIGFYDELLPAQLAALEAGGSGAEQLGRMLRVVFGVCATHHDELTILHYDWHILSSLDGLTDVHDASLETLRLWRLAIDAGKADGSIDDTVDTDAMVRIATSSIHALIDTVRYSDRPLQLDRSDELAAMLERVLLHGVARSESSARPARTTTPAGRARART